MARTWRRGRIVAMAAVGGVGLLTTMLAVATVVLVVTDPAGTAAALDARDAGTMINALASLMWRAINAVLEYL